jgi:hypothetical protein
VYPNKGTTLNGGNQVLAPYNNVIEETDYWRYNGCIFAIGQWQHIALVNYFHTDSIDGVQVQRPAFRFYFNGIHFSSMVCPNVVYQGDGWETFLSSRESLSEISDIKFTKRMAVSEVQVYGRTLDADDIFRLFGLGMSGLAQQGVTYNTSGTVTYDEIFPSSQANLDYNVSYGLPLPLSKVEYNDNPNNIAITRGRSYQTNQSQPFSKSGLSSSVQVISQPASGSNINFASLPIITTGIISARAWNNYTLSHYQFTNASGQYLLPSYNTADLNISNTDYGLALSFESTSQNNITVLTWPNSRFSKNYKEYVDNTDDTGTYPYQFAAAAFSAAVANQNLHNIPTNLNEPEINLQDQVDLRSNAISFWYNLGSNIPTIPGKSVALVNLACPSNQLNLNQYYFFLEAVIGENGKHHVQGGVNYGNNFVNISHRSDSSMNVSNGGWHHIVISLSAPRLSSDPPYGVFIYHDSKLILSNNFIDSGTPNKIVWRKQFYSSNYDVVFGARNGGEHLLNVFSESTKNNHNVFVFQGQIAGLSYYDQYITADHVAMMYRAKKLTGADDTSYLLRTQADFLASKTNTNTRLTTVQGSDGSVDMRMNSLGVKVNQTLGGLKVEALAGFLGSALDLTGSLNTSGAKMLRMENLRLSDS